VLGVQAQPPLFAPASRAPGELNVDMRRSTFLLRQLRQLTVSSADKRSSSKLVLQSRQVYS
jgi:hypothetical protein